MSDPTLPDAPPIPDPDRRFDTSHLKRDLGRRAIRGGALVLLSHGIRFVLETGRIIVLARLLSPADYGLVAMVTVVTGFVGMFQDLGLNTATVTRERVTHAQLSTVFWINVAIGVLLSVATAALAPALAWFYGESRLTAITLVLAPSFLVVGLSVQHQALLRRQMRFVAIAVIRVASVLAGLVVGIAMAYVGSAYWALVWMTLATAATNVVAVWIAFRWMPGRPVRGSGAGDMVRFGVNITGVNMSSYLSRRLDYLLLGWWWGAVPLGLYTKASSLVEAPITHTLTPMGSVFVTSLSRLSEDPDRYRTAYLRILEKLALAFLPLSVFMIASADWLIPFLLGDQWVEAAPVFAALALLGFARPVEHSSLWLFITQDRAHASFRWSVFSGLVTGAAAVAGLPWGGLGVALALSISGLLRMPLLVWYVTQTGPIRAADIYRTLFPAALASACALLLLYALAPRAEALGPVPALAGGVAVTVAVVLAILLLLPGGRRALVDVWSTLQTIRGQREAR